MFLPTLGQGFTGHRWKPVLSSSSSSVIKLHEGRRLQAPRLCHVTRSSMSPSATPARQSATAPRATNGAQARHQIHPNVFKCHTCHAKRRSMSPRATPATQNRRSRSPSTTPATHSAAARRGRLMAPKRATRSNPVSYAPRLPRKTKVDVSKCYPCQAKQELYFPPLL